MTWMREIERWLVERVLPFAPDYRRLASRLVGQDEADDVVQDAYARLIAYERWREIDNPRAMCLRTVRNLALDRLRSADVVHIDRIAAIESLDIADERPDAFRVSAGRLEVERLMALIDRLPAQCGRVVRRQRERRDQRGKRIRSRRHADPRAHRRRGPANYRRLRRSGAPGDPGRL